MDSSDVAERLDEIIRNNRFTIAFIFPILGSIIMILSANYSGVPEPLRFNPVLILVGVVVMRLPLISGILPLINKKSIFVLGTLVAYTYLVEIVAVRTGYPYGEFQYGISLGPMFMDIPLALPLFFIPLVLNSYLLCILLFESASNILYRIPLVVAIVIVIDMVLDPAAVAIGFWSYDIGVYYGVPISNYIGWIISATVATVLIDAAFDHRELKNRVKECDYLLDDLVSFVILWGIVNLFYFSIIPSILTGILIISLIVADDFDLAI